MKRTTNMNSVSIMKEIKDDSRREPIKSVYTFGVKTTALALIPIQHVQTHINWDHIISYHPKKFSQILPFAFSIIHTLIVFTNMAKYDANHISSWSIGRIGGWRRRYGLQSETQDRRRRRNTFDILFFAIFLSGRVKYFFVQFSLKIVSDSTYN